MPVDVVRLKAGRQKDGVKLLAGSYDATPKNLCKWVGKSELENVLKQYGPLPETFRELDEKELVELQSRTKIVFAIGAQNEISAIGSLVGRPNPLEFMNSPLFRHCNRIISMYYALQHDKGAGGYFLDGENLMRLMLWEQIPFDPLTFEVLAHDAFMVPSNIPAMLGGYCRKNPTKAETAIQFLKWCSENYCPVQAGSNLIYFAMKFNQPDLAFDIGKQVLATPDNVQGFCVQAYKAAVLIALGKDERIKSAMEEFSEQIRRHWQGDQWDLRLEDYGKKAILRVFLRTGHLEGFHEMYMDLWNHMQLSDPDDELIEDLFHFGQDELGRDVIHRNLTEESKYPLARIRNICQFTQRIVKTDRTKLLPLLKEKVGALHITDQASVLLGLASCSKDPTDTVYVISQEACVADELENKKETNYELYLVLATINYHVGNEELTNTYYSQWVQQLLKKHQKLQEYDVYKLKEAGLALEDLKDLNSMNPSEVVAKLWQTEIQKDFKGFMFDY